MQSAIIPQLIALVALSVVAWHVVHRALHDGLAPAPVILVVSVFAAAALALLVLIVRCALDMQEPELQRSYRRMRRRQL